MAQPSRIIVLTGPESVGKTTLSEQLCRHFDATLLPELARSYVENLGRPYTLADVLQIAHSQIAAEKVALAQGPQLLICDTDLLITKVWLEVVYQHVPDWIEAQLRNQYPRHHLLLDTAPAWQPDPVRENGGEAREQLLQHYERELLRLRLPYTRIGGLGRVRVLAAQHAVERMLSGQ